MTHDKLKDFIDQNKEAFDSEEVPAGLWSKIDSDLGAPVKRGPSKRRYMAIAASVAIILSLGVVFLGDRSDSQLASEVVTEEANDMASGLLEIDHYYATQVSEKMAALNDYEVDAEFLEELEVLKEEFDELQAELEIGANPELIIEAMIDNYRLRISILEDLLDAMKQERINSTPEQDEIV